MGRGASTPHPGQLPPACPARGSAAVSAEASGCPHLQRGLPREFADYETNYRPAGFEFERLPVPWINTSQAKSGAFTLFDEHALAELHQAGYLLCSVCGEELEDTKVFGVLATYTDPNTGEELIHTSGSAMHPRCAALAYHYCPHFFTANPEGRSEFAIYEGPEHGLQLRYPDLSTYEKDVNLDDPAEVLQKLGVDAFPDISDVPIAVEVELCGIGQVKKIAREQAQATRS